MKKIRVFIIIILGSLFILNLTSLNSATQKNINIKKDIFINTQLDPVNISLDKRMIRSSEKIKLTIEVTNFYEIKREKNEVCRDRI